MDVLLEWVYGEKHGWFYSHLSGFAHASMYTMLQGAEVVEDHGGGIKTARARADMMKLSTTTITCAHCHCRVLRLLGKAAGCLDSPQSPLETVKYEGSR